jgi:hypothetical protein
MTTMTLTARSVETRLRPLYATGLILAALLSACVAHDGRLRLAYFLTIPFTRCAFFTLRRFREPALHRQARESRLSGHLGQIVRAALQPKVALIFGAAAFVAGALIMMCATLSMIVVKRQ